MIPQKEEMNVIIDEIGKMECYSPFFRETIIQILDSKYSVIGSIPLRGNLFIEQIKKRKDVLLIQVSEKNRDMLVSMFR
jgi:nucleoside-triphosphatase